MTAQITPGPWSQGFLIFTSAVRSWSVENQQAASAIERRMVFSNFRAVDEGRSRKRIAIFEREEDAVIGAAAPDLLEALTDILGPLNVCSENSNVDDDAWLPIDITMGELRKARAAIAKAKGEK